VNISAPSASLTRTGPITYTITYGGADAVTLVAGNVTLNTTGDATGTVAVTGSGNVTRTVTISSITGNGTLGISIASGTASDTAGNTAPSAGPSPTFTVDNTAPTVNIGAPSASLTRTGPITYTITYGGADAVTLVAGDVTLNATGGATGSVAVTGTGNVTRTVTISSITGNGTLGISIAAATASDNAGNTAPASGPSTTFTVDNTAPTVNIGAPSASLTRTGPISYTITYGGADAVTLVAGDVTLNATGGATGSVAVTGTGNVTRTVTISSITGNGTLGISIASGTATDNAGNTAPSSGPSTTFTVDNTAPSVNISAPSASLTRTGPITYTITYGGADAVTLVAGDVTLNATGGATGSVAVTGTGNVTRTVTISSITGNGTLGISIAAATASDNAGNTAPASGPSTTFTVDNTAPTVNISAPSASLTRTGPITYTITYGGADAVTLVAGNVTLNATGGATGSVAVTGTGNVTRTVTISSITGNGTLGISIAAATASDNAGNTAPAAGPSTTFTVDNTAPSVNISAPSASLTRTGPITYTVTYGGADAVTLAAGNVTLNTTGDATGTVTVTGTGNVTRTVTISSITGNGTLGISIASGTATDNAGNTAPAAGPSATFTVDNTGPSATVITSLTASPTAGSVVDFAVHFSEEVQEFNDIADLVITVTGTVAYGGVTISGGPQDYTVSITGVTGDGTLSLAVSTASDVEDLTQNPFEFSVTSALVTIEHTAPTVSITSPVPDPTHVSPIPVTVTFSKSVTGFELSDVDVSNALAGNFQTVDAAHYTLELAPLDQGVVSASVAAGVAQDTVGHPNLASAPFHRAFDSIAPTATFALAMPSPTADDALVFEVVFSEPLSAGLVTGDIVLTGTLAAAADYSVAGVHPARTITVTPADPSADGTIGISIGAGLTDAAGNSYAGGASELYTVRNWFGFQGEPQAARVYTGESLQFSVSATHGNSTPSYQWWFEDGAQAPAPLGGNSAALTIEPALLTSAGRYWCVVTYFGADFTSDSNTLEVAEHLRITQQPVGGVFCAGQAVPLSVLTAGGFQPLTYEWRKEGVPIPGADDWLYTIAAAQNEHAGTYTVTVLDAHEDSEMSVEAQLAMEERPLPGAGLAGMAVLFGCLALLGIRVAGANRPQDR
jgi:hypothetical protein